MEKDVNTTGHLRPGPMDVIDYSKQVARTIGSCTPAEAASMVDSLNIDTVSSGLLNTMVMIESDFIIQKNFAFDKGFKNLGFQPLDDDVPRITNTMGKFIGFERLISGEDEILMYVLSMATYTDKRKFTSIFAPVLDTKILLDEITLEIHEAADKDRQLTLTKHEMLRRLSEFKDPTFSGNFDMFAEIVDRNATKSLQQIKDAAGVAYNLYNDPLIESDAVARYCVLNLFAGLFELGEGYRLNGQHIEKSNDTEIPIDVYFVDNVKTIIGVCMVIDYSYDTQTRQLEVFKDGLQPALLMKASNGDTFVMPIVQLTKFVNKRPPTKSKVPPVSPG